MASDGIVLTGDEGAITAVETPALAAGATPTPTVPDDSGTVANIVIYIDYLCPFCGQFEATNSESIRAMVESGAATLEMHPIAILTNKSAGTQYSLRAANAAACVADYSPDSSSTSTRSCSRTSPKRAPTGSRTTRSKQLAERGRRHVACRRIEQCIDDEQFKSWVQDATEPRADPAGAELRRSPSITGTPTVLVNGKQYVGSLDGPGRSSRRSCCRRRARRSTTPSRPRRRRRAAQ